MIKNFLLALLAVTWLASPVVAAEKKHAEPTTKAAAKNAAGKKAPAAAAAADDASDDDIPAKGGKKAAPEPSAYTADGFPVIETQAQFALVVDYNTGATLLDKNADQSMFPSSMTKMMTSYIVFDKLQKGDLKMTDTFPVSENAWRKGGAVSDSSTMFLELGSRASVEDLVQGVVVQSGNDACIVLAEGLFGSEEAFAEEMNRRAKAMGMNNTNFRNSTGYPDPDHRTTARDLAILARHTIEDHPEYYKIYSQVDFTYNKHRQGNRNPLLYRNIGADGLKTGHTEISGYGLTGSAIRDGRRIIMVINGLPTKKSRAVESERLIDWAFREFDDYTLFKAGDAVDTADVWLGTAKTVPLVAGKPVTVTLPRRARKEMKVVVSYNGPLAAPIKKGDEVARLLISAPGVVPVAVPILAGADVARLGAFGRMTAAASFMIFGNSK